MKVTTTVAIFYNPGLPCGQRASNVTKVTICPQWKIITFEMFTIHWKGEQNFKSGSGVQMCVSEH